ncbi:MAG: class I SAM-dependent methyltransferase [Lactobacillaceae bacterium]|jgi:SAM-dependent methyltransferase|nr:class I SAM-dependent methyltransferase [Lactobacillaceae bacterium]
MENYSTFAQLYDQLFDSSLYLQWRSFVLPNSRPGKLLDIGGGNGQLGVMLAADGYDVTILDLSLEMLQIAQTRAENAHRQIDLVNDNMLTFELDEVFSTITSFTDSINYLSSQEQLLQTFKNVYAHLDDDGVFLFDLITPHMANVTYDNYMYNDDSNEDAIFMWTSYPGDEPDSVDHDLKFFIYDDKIDGYKIVREIHHEQTYPSQTVVDLLKEAGFTSIEISADYGESKVEEDTDRVFYKVQK